MTSLGPFRESLTPVGERKQEGCTGGDKSAGLQNVQRASTPGITPLKVVCNAPDSIRQVSASYSSALPCHLLACYIFIMSSCAFHFAYVFVSCIRAFSPLSVLQSGAPISSGAPFLSSFVCVCQTFSEWTKACHVVLIYHPKTTGQVSFHSEVVWYSNG